MKIITETIDQDLKCLIPSFIKNTELEVAELSTALDRKDLSTINRVGHNIKGTALNYGFIHLAEIGRHLERAALDEDILKIEQLIVQFKEYLLKVEIVFE